jgi:hypothetical protein
MDRRAGARVFMVSAWVFGAGGFDAARRLTDYTALL